MSLPLPWSEGMKIVKERQGRFMMGKTIWAVSLLRAMDEISRERDDGSPINKTSMAERTGLGVDYIEQLLVPLRIAGFIDSRRGIHGGFVLVAGNLTLRDVRLAMEPSRSLSRLPENVQELIGDYEEQVGYLESETQVIG